MKPKKVKMEKVETLKYFMLDTTLHGARFVFAKSLPRRCLWTLILVGSFAFCQYHTYESWMQFLQRPFSVGITLESTKESTLTFPAVTLCNVNPQNAQRGCEANNRRCYQIVAVFERVREWRHPGKISRIVWPWQDRGSMDIQQSSNRGNATAKYTSNIHFLFIRRSAMWDWKLQQFC